MSVTSCFSRAMLGCALGWASIAHGGGIPLSKAEDACAGASLGKIPLLTGEWKGAQKRWDAQGNLVRALESKWSVRLVESYPPALGIEASYFEADTGKQISNRIFQLVCSSGSGTWTQDIAGFGRVELYAKGDFLHHVVTAEGPTGTSRSVSLFSFPTAKKLILTSDWFQSGEYAGHTVNQMVRVEP
jgi:hypothetical protein